MKNHNPLRFLRVVTVALLVTLPRESMAQASAADRAAAEVLFNQALELLEKGKAAEACPKLQESQRLDPGVGTLLYLADCYKQTGRTASAWATFRDAAYAARAAGQADREELANKEAAALEGSLSKLTISVERPDTPGLRVLRDGQEVGRPLWDAPVPADPGRISVSAEAPGMLPWKSEVEVPTGPGSTSVRIPALAPAPASAPAPATAPPSSRVAPVATSAPPRQSGSRGGLQRGLGWGAIGLGGVGLVTGGVLALIAKANYESSKDECREDADASLCSAEGIRRGESAAGLGNAASVVVGIGGALLVGGIVVVATAPSSSPASSARVTLAARAGADSAMLAVRGAW